MQWGEWSAADKRERDEPPGILGKQPGEDGGGQAGKRGGPRGGRSLARLWFPLEVEYELEIADAMGQREEINQKLEIGS